MDGLGRPETVTTIAPLAVLKGQVPGTLVLHQLGGTMPDGRFFKLWGRPEYQVGREVIVFAIARPEGDYQTAELLLGKFEIQQDERGSSFAVPALVADDPAQVTVTRHRLNSGPGHLKAARIDDVLAPRDLGGFLLSLRSPQGNAPSLWIPPHGALTPVVHPSTRGVESPPSGSTSAATGVGTMAPRRSSHRMGRPTSPAAESRRRPARRSPGTPNPIRRSTIQSVRVRRIRCTSMRFPRRAAGAPACRRAA